MTRCLGVVLAGGRSRRFGRDKALERWNGATFLEHAVVALQELHLPVIVVTASERCYPGMDCPIVKDIIPNAGPLGGLHTAFEYIRHSSETSPVEGLLVLTCDMPCLTAKTVSLLMTAHRRGSAATLFSLNRGAFQPFPGLYAVTTARLVAAQLAADRQSMQEFISSLSDTHMIETIVPMEEFINVNTAEDMLREKGGNPCSHI